MIWASPWTINKYSVKNPADLNIIYWCKMTFMEMNNFLDL